MNNALSRRLRETLRDLAADPEAFAADLAMSAPDDMRPFGYNYYYLNLLSVFGRTMPRGAIESLALACTRHKMWSAWSYCRYWVDMSHGLACRSTVRLRGWRRTAIADLLAGGRGLIVMTAHFGDFRSVPSDLAILGFTVTVAADANSAGDRNRLLRLYPVALAGDLRYADVESAAHASLGLVAALRRNEIVTVVVDGNTGVDGKWGASNRLAFNFLGRSVCVKQGAGLLAAATGAPVLPVIASAGPSGSGCAFFSDPIVAAPDRSRDENADRAIVAYYRWLESWIRRHPQQWEAANLLHRARFVEGAGRQRASNGGDAGPALPCGTRLRLDLERVAVLPGDTGIDLVDTDTLRVWRVADSLAPIVDLLASETGVPVGDDGLPEANDAAAARLLSRLYAAGAIETRPVTGAPAAALRTALLPRRRGAA